MVAGGCHSGGLGWWDTRAGPGPAAVVDREQGHVAPVYRWRYPPLLLTILPLLQHGVGGQQDGERDHDRQLGLHRQGRQHSAWLLELETKVHPKIRNHGEGPY